MTENNNQEPTTEETPKPQGDEQPAADPKPKMMPVSAHEIQVKKAVDAAVAEALRAKAESDEQKKLEEQNEFKQLYEQEKAKAEAAVKAAEATARTATLRAELSGIQNKYALRGVIDECPADADPVEWAAQFRKDNPDLFTVPAAGPVQPASQGGRSAGGSTNTLEERAANGDRAAMSEYFKGLGKE